MTQLRTLKLDQITEAPFNPRRHFDPTTLAELATSIKANGVLQPILVRPVRPPLGNDADAFQIIAGARRYRASLLAEQEHIPAVVREMDDRTALEVAVIENLQREDVHPLEEAEGYERLMKDASYDADQLGEKVGKSRSYIYGRLKLLDLCLEARDAFYEGRLDASTALLVARIPGKVLQKKAVKDLTNGYGGAPMAFRAAKEHVQRTYMLNLKEATFRPADAKLVPEAGSCTDCPKRTGNNPELFGDVENANVCTDPGCYENKRQEHYLKLKENAEKKGIKVIQGEEAKKIMPYGEYSLRDGYASLDSEVDGSDGRTYRDILGKAAPVSAVIENNGYEAKKRPLIEIAEESALAEALKKAGFTPSEMPSKTDGDDEYRQRQAAAQAEREAREIELEIEKRYRVKLFERVREKNALALAENKALATGELVCLATGFFDQLYYTEADIPRLMEMWGRPYDDEEDEETNINGFVEHVIRQMDAGGLCLFLFDLALLNEVIVTQWNYEHAPARLEAEGARHGIDSAALRADIKAELNPAKKPAAKGRKKTQNGSSPILAAPPDGGMAEETTA